MQKRQCINKIWMHAFANSWPYESLFKEIQVWSATILYRKKNTKFRANRTVLVVETSSSETLSTKALAIALWYCSYDVKKELAMRSILVWRVLLDWPTSQKNRIPDYLVYKEGLDFLSLIYLQNLVHWLLSANVKKCDSWSMHL